MPDNKAQKINEDTREDALKPLKNWVYIEDRDAITRRYEFRDFSACWGFMSRCALLAEKMNHHPEWLNVWNRVDVVLTTHDLGGLSTLDTRMATAMDELAAIG